MRSEREPTTPVKRASPLIAKKAAKGSNAPIACARPRKRINKKEPRRPPRDTHVAQQIIDICKRLAKATEVMEQDVLIQMLEAISRERRAVEVPSADTPPACLTLGELSEPLHLTSSSDIASCLMESIQESIGPDGASHSSVSDVSVFFAPDAH